MGPQLAALFAEVVGPFRDGALLEEVVTGVGLEDSKMGPNSFLSAS